jgi:twinkle protein
MTFSEYGITIPAHKHSGEITTICPKCSPERKKKNIKCLSVNLDKSVWHCHHCGWNGFLKSEPIEKKIYVKPDWKNKTELSNQVVKWFEGRGINQETLKFWKISEGLEFMPQVGKEVNTIQFNYFNDQNELINVKYRDGAKNFKLHKGSQLIFYGLNAFKSDLKAFLCEGEVDLLSLYQSGYKNVLSVPNGANLKNNNLEYLDEVADKFINVPEFYLCFDNDNAGRRLRDEIAERLGKERCKYIEFKDCKDANECLQKYGIQGIIESVSQPKEFPLEGVFTVKDIENEIDDIYINGLEPGLKIGHPNFDNHLTFVPGYITTITGIPGHGKSDFLDEIILRLHFKHGWRNAYYSPENKPTELHFSKLARKVLGKSFEGKDKMSMQELRQVKEALNNKVWFVKPEKDFTLDSILNHVKSLKFRFGLDSFVIDAWNKLEHKFGQSETKYIGESMDKLGMFCENYKLHCFLVAHPTKIMKDKQTGKYEVPNLYNISGSANFFNKTDNGLTVYRDFIDNITTVHIQKVKFNHWGKVGYSDFQYHLNSGRYIENGIGYSSDSWIQLIQSEFEYSNEFINDIVLNKKLDLPF